MELKLIVPEEAEIIRVHEGDPATILWALSDYNKKQTVTIGKDGQQIKSFFGHAIIDKDNKPLHFKGIGNLTHTFGVEILDAGILYAGTYDLKKNMKTLAKSRLFVYGRLYVNNNN